MGFGTADQSTLKCVGDIGSWTMIRWLICFLTSHEPNNTDHRVRNTPLPFSCDVWWKNQNQLQNKKTTFYSTGLTTKVNVDQACFVAKIGLNVYSQKQVKHFQPLLLFCCSHRDFSFATTTTKQKTVSMRSLIEPSPLSLNMDGFSQVSYSSLLLQILLLSWLTPRDCNTCIGNNFKKFYLCTTDCAMAYSPLNMSSLNVPLGTFI